MLHSFRGRMAALFGLIVLVSSATLALWLGAAMARDRVDAQGHALQEIARSIGVVLGAGLDDRLHQIERLADNDLFPYAKHLVDIDNGTLDRVAASRSHYSWIGVTDARGQVRAATRGMLVGRDVGERPWFKSGLEGAHAGDVHPAKLLAAMLPASADGGPARFIDFAAPLRDPQGRVVGVLGAHVNWDWSRDVIASLLDDSPGQRGIEVYVLDRQGKVILRPLGLAADAPPPPLPASGAAQLTGADGQTFLSARAGLPVRADPAQLGWTVLVRQSDAVALAPAREAERTVWLLGLLVAVFAMAAAWLMAGSLARPLMAIHDAARGIEAGRLDTPMPRPQGASELRALGGALASMTQSLVSRERALREANELLELRVAQRTRELELLNHELHSLAHVDALTGLPNRRSADERLDAELQRARRHRHPLALLMVDIDRFKSINDTHGHAAGDIVLAQVAQALRRTCRGSDVVARLGGEEFLVLLPETDGDGARLAAEKLRAAVEALALPLVGRATVSIGVALSAEHFDPVAGALQAADAALYAAKGAGRNRVMVHGELLAEAA